MQQSSNMQKVIENRRFDRRVRSNVKVIPYLVAWMFAGGKLPPGWGKNVQPQ